MDTLKPYITEIKSWVLTVMADLAVDFAAGLLVGLGTLIETGDISTSAIMAVATATARSVLKLAMSRTGAALKEAGELMQK